MDRVVEVCFTSADADLELMAGVGASDPSAKRVLVQRLAGRVRKLAGMLCRNAADADDAAQLALIEILRSARGFRVSINLDRWAERVTVRATRRTARRERARKGLLQRWLAPNVQPWGSSATQPAADQIGLDTLLQRLSTERHQVLVLHHALDYTVDEISELTGAPVGTVKDRLIMARKQLRRLLESELGASEVELV